MAAIGFVLHHERAQAAELARETTAWLAGRGATRCGCPSPTPTSQAWRARLRRRRRSPRTWTSR